MVIIRAYEAKDFEEVVDMYHKMVLEVYPHREFKEKQYFYNNVIRWISLNYDIIVTEKDEVVTGFSLCYVDSMGGICDDFYQGECIYVKPEFRKTRSAYLMYHTNINFAQSQGMILSTNASSITESHHIAKKLGKEIFKSYERMPT